MPLDIHPREGLLVECERGWAVCGSDLTWTWADETRRVDGATWAQVVEAIGQPVQVVEPES